ncbi:hypothetical protein BCR35DRAFT_330600 [Leucosporidium creatinivorum]|uniref:Uncharacterized protein n=1 Tax=Leucosporidium creatinivorum TaxID=106004 RepID=A0A1Y2FRT8_9BASI|nr:hypothetical protein BCR35DRAFT_330600 [Leucosporidium creatinivorum]
MKFSLVALATFALAAGVQAQIEIRRRKVNFLVINLQECQGEINSGDDATALKGVECLCSDATSKLLLACSGCVSNSTQGHILVDSWNSGCTAVYANKTALTWVAGTATASSSAADSTSTSKDSGSAKQVVAGGLGLLLAGGLALLA